MVPDGENGSVGLTRPSVFFRVDSSGKIGSGHLRRCLTLAGALAESGAEVSFISRSHVDNLNHQIVEAGFAFHELAGSGEMTAGGYADWLGVDELADAHQSAGAINGRPCDALIVDHYALGIDWHRFLRPFTQQIVVIDDLCNRLLDCDILIDTAPGDANRYDALIPTTSVRLLGPGFVMLGPAFRQQKDVLRKRSGSIQKVLIAFGGFDPGNASNAAIDGVRHALGDGLHIDVVLGRNAPHLEGIRSRAAIDCKTKLHVDTADMAKLMVDADIAIGAGGTTSWERAYLGLPTLVAMLATNQQTTVTGLVNTGCALLLSDHLPLADAVAQSLSTLVGAPGIMTMMSRVGEQLVDGRGVSRIVKHIMLNQIELRPAGETDAEQLWLWRNDNSVRTVSLCSEPISFQSHLAWFVQKMADPASVIMIGECAGTDVGVVRYYIQDGIARVSIQLAPEARGRGLGGDLLKAGESWLLVHRRDVAIIHADVLPHNSASVALFQAASYEPFQYQFRRKLVQ